MKSPIAKNNTKLKKEIYKMLVDLKLIVGNEKWHTSQYPSDKSETIYSNIKLKGFSREIKVYTEDWDIYDKKIYKKYDVMRWSTDKKSDGMGKIVYNLKEELFKQQMNDIINEPKV